MAEPAARINSQSVYRRLRSRSGNRHYKHPSKLNVVTIPRRPGDDLPVGTLKPIFEGRGTGDEAISQRYAVIFEQAESNWAAYVPDLPGCITTGKTFEETERNIREAIQGHLRTLLEFGEPVRRPTSLAREIEIPPTA